MARKLDEVMAALPKERQRRVEARAMELATLKDLRLAALQTQEQMAAALGVGQDTISRLERRSDMLLSTLRHYVESMGGEARTRGPVPEPATGGDQASGRRIWSTAQGFRYETRNPPALDGVV